MNSILTLLMFGATLVPSAASQYKYHVPPVEYWSLVDGVGMGDTFSYRSIRYTDIVWLGNATREYDKIQGDLFTTPRLYWPFYQTTNTLTMILKKTYGEISSPRGYYANWDSAFSLPKHLDGDKDISANIPLPAGYNGSAIGAWPTIANVSSSDQWSTSSLFTELYAHANSRVVLLSTITNTYWSLKKLHTLKWVSPQTGIYNSYPSGGYRIEQDGNSVDTYYDWDWETESWTASVYTNSYTLSGAGQFTFVAYSYSSKSYNSAWDEDDNVVLSPVQSTIKRGGAYPYFTAMNAIPCTLVINDPIGGVYNSDKQRIGDDISWSERIESFKRVSCFSIATSYTEYFAATAPGVYQSTNYSDTAYVLVDTSDGFYVKDPISNDGLSFNRICKGFNGLTLGDSRNFFRSILGSARLQELAKLCQNPREPVFDEYDDPDYWDYPSRELKYTVSHLWSITVVKPKYTCKFDGN